MFWTKLLKRLSEDVNEHLLLQNELLKAQVLELQTHHNGRVRYSAFFKRRMARLAKLLTPEGLSDSCLVVKPSTVLRWHRELIAKKFDGSAMRTYPGRPRIDAALEAHILDMADNNRWGAMRIKGAWMLQIARNLTGVDDEFLKGSRYLICDRDTKYTRQFRRVFRGYGVKVIRLPPYSPNLNAHAERWVRAIYKRRLFEPCSAAR